MRWSRDDGLATVARTTPDQGVEHAALSADVANSARLMHVEMRRVIENAVAHHAARFWIGLRAAICNFEPSLRRNFALHNGFGTRNLCRRQAHAPRLCPP